MMTFIVNMLKKKILVGRSRVIPGLIKQKLRQLLFSPSVKIFGLNILTREEILNNREKYKILQFGHKELIGVSKPDNISEELSSLTQIKNSNITLIQPFVFEMKTAELISSAAIGFDRDKQLIAETIPTSKLGRGNLEKYLPIRTLILKKIPELGVPQFDTVCSLVTWRSKNYFHWITDCLIRLEGLEYYQQQTGKKPILVIDSKPPKWQIESLRLLGYDSDRCLRWDRSRIKVKELVVLSIRREQRLPSPAACFWFRQRILSNLPNIESQSLSFSSRIYIARPKTAGRQVINEDDVLKALTPLGFVAYTLEKMSFSDQVRLFAQAETVVASHGAGLVNMIFAQHLNVIELFGATGNPDYFLLAKAMGFHYACLASDTKGWNQYSEKFNGLVVDVAQLQALVTKILHLPIPLTQHSYKQNFASRILHS